MLQSETFASACIYFVACIALCKVPQPIEREEKMQVADDEKPVTANLGVSGEDSPGMEDDEEAPAPLAPPPAAKD